MKKLTIIITALGLLAACTKQSDDMAVLQPDQNNSTQGLKQARPFKATLNAVADANAPQTACSGVVPFAAPDFLVSGSATHMGPLNSASRLHHVSCDVNAATALLTTSVSVDLVADNGDVLHCTGDDTVNVTVLLGGTAPPTITGTWTINGGTGRFNDATGSVRINGLVDFATFSFSCDVVGTVNY